MDLFPKFIIEDDYLILSKVSFHQELVTDPAKVKGGGWFRYLGQTDMFIFYGDSHDYGKAELEDIINCIKSNKVFTNIYQTVDISLKHNFGYDNGSEIIDITNK